MDQQPTVYHQPSIEIQVQAISSSYTHRELVGIEALIFNCPRRAATNGYYTILDY